MAVCRGGREKEGLILKIREQLTGTMLAVAGGFLAAGAVWAQTTILTPNVGVGTSNPVYFMDVNGGGGSGIGAPPGMNIRVPNAVGQFNSVRFSTATGDGSLAGLSGEVVASGSYPNSAGRVHFWVQDGSVTRPIAVFSKFGVQVLGGGGNGLGFPSGLTLNVPNAVGQYNGLRFSTMGGDGSLAGLHAEVVAAGAFPATQGRVHVWVQNGAATRDMMVITPTDVSIAGNVSVSGNIAAKYQDVAEWVPTVEKISPATVVIIDPSRDNHVLPASTPYDQRVAGVISERPGVLLGDGGDDHVKVAHSGRVKMKVDASYGSVAAGDLLVTSATPGYAMRSEPVKVGEVQMHRPGTLIGKALEPLADGKGEILVLLLLQ
jgi:hypothetical protein